MTKNSSSFEGVFMLSEILIIILFATCTKFGAGTFPTADLSGEAEAIETTQSLYPFFQDVHVMIFIGFGFLMVFLKEHSWTSVGYNFLIACYAMQITMLIMPFFHMIIEGHGMHKIEFDLTSLIGGDFGAGAVLITFGAVLGKVSLKQLWLLTTLEIIFYSINESIAVSSLKVNDMGGSMFVHTFGAYFGVGASFFFQPKRAIRDEPGKCVGSYNSELIAMVGTIFLWMYWPSFNGALASGSFQQRVIINTVLSISASCISACAFSRYMMSALDMEVVLNATLAGGVAIGTSCDMFASPAVALIIGSLAGIVSAFGFLKLGPYLQEKIGLHDTCGVHNLHGIPGIMGAICGSIAVGVSESTYENNRVILEHQFPELANGRSVQTQAINQFFALIMTVLISLVGGAISGFIVSKFVDAPEELFDDKQHFHHVEYPTELQQSFPLQDLESYRAALTARDAPKPVNILAEDPQKVESEINKAEA